MHVYLIEFRFKYTNRVETAWFLGMEIDQVFTIPIHFNNASVDSYF